MKNHLLITGFFFIFFSCTVSAQKYTYTYDAAGNRISVLLFKSSSADQDSSEAQKPFTIADQGREFKLYPNPTKGLITIECPGLTEPTPVICALFDGGGKLINKSEADNTQTLRYDLSTLPNGLYIMQIMVNSTTHVIKVLKE